MDPAVVKSMLNSSAGKGVLPLKDMMGTYVWLSDERFLLPSEGHAMISFEARGTNDIHVSFNEDCSQIEGREGLRERSPYYEIVLGGWMNSKTVIRKRGQQQVAIRKEDNPNAVITCKTHFARYWVFLDLSAGQVIVGKGAPGTNEIIRYKDTKEADAPTLRYFGFSSWNQPIQYRAIMLTEGHTALSSLLNLSSLPAPTVYFTQFFNDQTLSDLTIVVEGERFYGHRFLFHCRAPDLYEFLLQERDGANAKMIDEEIIVERIEDEDFTAKNFKKLLQFLYCGSLPSQAKRELESLHRLSKLTHFSRLERYCGTLLEADTPTLTTVNSTTTSPRTSSLLLSSSAARNSPELNWEEFGDFTSLIDSGAFSDITFVLPDEPNPTSMGDEKNVKRLHAHRAILAVASEVFYAMLARENFAESHAAEVTLHDVPYPSFFKLIECVYSRKPPTFNDICGEVLPLLMVADRFALDNFIILGKPLHEHCLDYVRCNISVKTCCPTLEVAGAFNLVELRQTCMQFIETYFEQVAVSKPFLRLEACVVLEIVLRDTLVVQKEEVVYEAVLRWGSYAPEARFESLKQVLSFVRCPLMDRDYLLQNVLDNECVKSSEELLNIVHASINYNRSLSSHSSDEDEAFPGIPCSYAVPPIAMSSSPPPANSPMWSARRRLKDSQQDINDFRLRPRASRSFEGWRELTFSGKPGDECGILYWIGSNYGTAKWQNPHMAKRVLVRCSSPPSRYTQPALLVDRRFVTTSYTSGNPAWYIIDLQQHSLICNYYTLRSDGSDSFLRNWNLQASSDGQEWTILRNHQGDTTLSTPGGWGAWPVVTKTGYRYFKIMMTGPNASSVSPRALALSTIELYGYCK